MSPLGSGATYFAIQRNVGLCSDCVAKVESCSATNFSENKKQETITQSYTLNRVAEVAGEFNARGSSLVALSRFTIANGMVDEVRAAHRRPR